MSDNRDVAAKLSKVDKAAILLLSLGSTDAAQLNAIKSLVAEDPGRVAQVVTGWINADE